MMQGVPKTYRVVQGRLYITFFNTKKWVERERERGQARRCHTTRSVGYTHAAGIDGLATIADLSATAKNIHYEKRDGSIKKEELQGLVGHFHMVLHIDTIAVYADLSEYKIFLIIRF